MVGSSHRLYSSRGRKRKTKTAAPGGRRAPETARAPETHRQDEDKDQGADGQQLVKEAGCSPPWQCARASGPCAHPHCPELGCLPRGTCSASAAGHPALSVAQQGPLERRKDSISSACLPPGPHSSVPRPTGGCWDVRGHHWVHSLHCRGCI